MDEDVPRQGYRVFLQESGHVIMAFPFKKEWSDLEVELQIREAFQDILPLLVDFEILQSVHTKLLKPTLAQGQYLTGALIHRIFRDKPVYVRPMEQILKPPKQRKTNDDLDDQVDNGFEATNGNVPLTVSNRATRENTTVMRNLPSVPQSLPSTGRDNNASDAMGSGLQSTLGIEPGQNTTVVRNLPSAPQSLPSNGSDNNASDAMGSGLQSTLGSEPASYENINASNSINSLEQLPNAYDNCVHALYETSPDDDADLLAAIYASLEDQKRSSMPSSEKEVDVVIRKFINDNLQHQSEEEYCNILINRKNLLSSTLAAIQRSTFSFVKPVHVSFSGEEAVDAGGPRREYFRLLMASLKNLGIFQGNWFSHDLHLLRSKKYELGGKLVSWSVLQGGPGPKCLSGEGFSVMSNLQIRPKDAIAAVKDEELKTVLNDLQSCSSSAEFSVLVERKADVIAGCGYSQIYTSDVSSKDEIILCLLKQSFVYSVHAEIQQFFHGLNAIGNLGNLLTESPKLFAALLGDNCCKLNAIAFKKLYNIDFSSDGSNQREKEEKTIYCFELFLQDLEEGLIQDLALEDLLIFITGADAIPPLGFDDPIVIAFYDMEENTKRLPWSSTCALTLNLPRGFDDPQEFNALISNALLNCYGFGKC